MSLTSKIESILFVSGKPLRIARIAKIADVKPKEVSDVIPALMEKLNTDQSGIHVIVNDDKLQLVTNPANTEVVDSLVKEEVSGELSRPSLETLTIIAYRGPVTKPEIEQIRGINCSVIIRNLLMRGLIEERDDKERLQPVYTISNDFVRHLGIHSVQDLPKYEELNKNASLDQILGDLNSNQPDEADNQVAV